MTTLRPSASPFSESAYTRLGSREYLTPYEVEKLIAAAKVGSLATVTPRGHRRLCRSLRASEIVDRRALAHTSPTLLRGIPPQRPHVGWRVDASWCFTHCGRGPCMSG